MLAPCILLIIAAMGGTLLTFTYDRQARFAVRLCMGTCTGLALMTTAGFVLGSSMGLNAGSIALSALLLLLPALLFLKPAYRELIVSETRSAARGGSRDLFHPTPAGAAYFIFYAGIAVLLGLVFARAMFERAGGIYTGLVNDLGDLPLHLQVINSFAQGHNLSAEDPTYAGVRFTYSLLADYLSAMLVRAGAGLAGSMWLPDMALALSMVGLLHHWTTALTRSRLAGLLATVLVLFSGGLGWWLIFQDVRNSDGGLLPLLAHLPHDYTIMGGSILRWGNSLTTLLVPQRSILFGAPLALCILYQWWLALAPVPEPQEDHGAPGNPDGVAAARGPTPPMKEGNGPGASAQRKPLPKAAAPVSPDNAEQSSPMRRLAAAGVCAGLLPLIHAHTFAATLGTAACLALLFRPLWRAWLAFFALTLALALPEVLWLFHNTGIATQKYFGWQTGWDREIAGNPPGQYNALWFWFVNTGFFLPLLAVALFRLGRGDGAARRLLRFYAPFALCFIVPNFMKLAPWIWDNVKVLFYWYLASVPLVAWLLAEWLQRRPRRWLAAGLLAAMALAGGLDVLRVVTNAMEYQEFSRTGIDTAQLISQLAGPRDVVLHAPAYDSPVFLTGRQSLLGYPGWIWSRGLDPWKRDSDIKSMYAGGADAEALLQRWRVDYVLIGPTERTTMKVNDPFWERYPKMAEIGEYKLYKVGRGR